MARKPVVAPPAAPKAAGGSSIAELVRQGVGVEIASEGTPEPAIIFSGLGPLASVWLGRELVEELLSVVALFLSGETPKHEVPTDALSQAGRYVGEALGCLNAAAMSVGLMTADEIGPLDPNMVIGTEVKPMDS